MANSLFGWDLLYRTVENDVKNNQDVLVCFAHFALISNGFKCIGLGESKTIDGSESKTEILPNGWTDDYAIRYVYQGRLYNLKGTNLDDGVMINLIRVDERNVSLLQLNTRAVVRRTGSLEQMIPDYEGMLDLIKKQLIENLIISKKSKEASSQTQQRESTSYGRDTGIPPAYVPPNLQHYVPPSIPNVGRNDLYPFGIDPLRQPSPLMPMGGGGMLFEPPGIPFPQRGSNSGLPPGALPPGARFDPFRPPLDDQNPGRRPRHRPDNDEMPPPGYDDMFM